MADEPMVTVTIRDDFYRDSFANVIMILLLILTVILGLIGIYIYLEIKKPKPVYFAVGADWRVLSDVPVSAKYLTHAQLLQWISDSLPKSFNYDFVNYNKQIANSQIYFTADGWRQFLNQLNIYANPKTIMSSKLFVHGSLNGGPQITNEGLINGRYGWWVTVPMRLDYYPVGSTYFKTLTFQVLVVRVPTLNNLAGVGIDNVLVEAGANAPAAGSLITNIVGSANGT